MNLAQDTTLKQGTYRVIKTLGQGSFGITYLAEHMALHKFVAIKEFFMKEVNSREASGSVSGIIQGAMAYNYAIKFQKEAANLASMDHPNIVRVTDSFAQNNTFYYVMDYVEGENLNDYILNHSLSEGEATQIILDVAKALQYMHEKKHMLHLDLKPGNIMRRKSDGHIFLIDFGLSKHFSENGQPETSTNIGLGTPGYAPIEQSNQSKNGDFRPTIDVYALGATFYKLLMRETPPYSSELLNEEKNIKTLLDRKGFSQETVNAITKAMSPLYKHRPQTVAEFIKLVTNSPKTKTPFEDTSSKKQSQEDTLNNSYQSQQNHQEKNSDRYYQSQKNWDYRTSSSKSNSTSANTTEYEWLEDNITPVEEKKSKTDWIVFSVGVCLFLVICIWIFRVRNKYEANPNKQENSYNITENLKDTNGNGYIRFTVKGVSFDMVPVEGGTFTMGAHDNQVSEAKYWEKPTRFETVSSFYIGETEVTQELWKAVMGKRPSFFKKGKNFPVEEWGGVYVDEFILNLNILLSSQLDGKRFRLPTEAEWEFAARGGNKSRGYKYSGSNTLDDVAWYDSNSGTSTHPVKTKSPNELGLYDMSGNVWEWCLNKSKDCDGWYRVREVEESEEIPADDDESCSVLRGGCCASEARDCCQSSRNLVGDLVGCMGLRLVLSKQ